MAICPDQVIAAQMIVQRGHANPYTSLGSGLLSRQWYLAEGSTNRTFHETLYILNPSTAATRVQVRRVLSRESTARMQSVSHDMGTPNVPPIGLGWLLVPFGTTTVLSMSGAAPGGVALLVVVPEHDLAYAAFGNDSRAFALHDQLLLWLLRHHLKVEVPDLVSETTSVGDLTPYAGTYRSNQLRVEVSVVDGQLAEQVTYEPLDDEQERIWTRFTGGSFLFPSRRLAPLRKDLFAPAGMPLQAFNGYARNLLVSYHGFSDGRATYRCAGGRMTRREQAG